MVSKNNHDGRYYGVHGCDVNQEAKNGYFIAIIASVPKSSTKETSSKANVILHKISPLYL